MLPLLRDKKNDEALRAAVDFVASTIQGHGGRQAAAGAAAASSHGAERTRSGLAPVKEHGSGAKTSILTWVCLGGGRSWSYGSSPEYSGVCSGALRARATPAARPGRVVLGAGAAGCLPRLSGGSSGAAAGSWIYDSFFRHGNSGGSEAYGGESHGGSGDAGQGQAPAISAATPEAAATSAVTVGEATLAEATLAEGICRPVPGICVMTVLFVRVRNLVW